MATIETFSSGDTGSSVLGDLNTNFSNLNTDKIEADSTDTLTNKTIDIDNNTVSNIETDNFKSTAKTGLDTKVVTGTAGSNGELATWNADGDVDSDGVSVTTTAPTSSSDDTTVPTSEAVREAIVAAVGSTKTIFVPVTGGNTITSAYDTAVGDFVANTPGSNDNVYFNFKIPDDFGTLSEADIVMIPDATETIQYDLYANYGQVGEAYNFNDEEALNETASATTSQLLEADATGVLSSVTAGDYVGLRLNSDTDVLQIIGLSITYVIA